MTTRIDAPPACPSDAGYTCELQTRHRQLEDLAVDEDAQALTATECDELESLRGLFKRFCAWRGQVDRHYENARKEANRPPRAFDQDNSLGAAMKQYRDGQRRPALEVSRNRRHQGTFKGSAARTPGTGVDRMADAIRRGVGFTR